MPNLTKNNLALNRSDVKRKTWSPVFSCATGSLPVFTLGLGIGLRYWLSIENYAIRN